MTDRLTKFLIVSIDKELYEKISQNSHSNSWRKLDEKYGMENIFSRFRRFETDRATILRSRPDYPTHAVLEIHMRKNSY